MQRVCAMKTSYFTESLSIFSKTQTHFVQNLHCRGLFFLFCFVLSSQMHRIRHSSCLILAAVFSWHKKDRKKERKRRKETHTCPGVCMSGTSESGTTRTDASLPLLVEKSVCVFFCSSEKKKKEEVRMHENAKGSRRCTKALCESLLSNNATVTAAPLFQFQAPLC